MFSKRNNFAGLGLIVQFVAILQSESVNVDDHRLLAGQLNCLLHVGNLVALAGGHQHVQRVRRTAGDLVVKIHIRNIKRNVFLGVPAKRLVQFVLAHLREDNVLDDHRVAAHAGCDSRGFDLVLVENAGDNVRNVIELHDLTINDGVGLKILKSQVNKLIAVALLLELDCLYRAGTNIEANQILLAVAFFEHDLFIPRDKERADSVLLTEASARFHCSRQPALDRFVDLRGLLIVFQSYFPRRCL